MQCLLYFSCGLRLYHDNTFGVPLLRKVLERKFDAAPIYLDTCCGYLPIHDCVYLGLFDYTLGHDRRGLSYSGKVSVKGGSVFKVR